MAATAKDIAVSPEKLAHAVSHSLGLSTSPAATFHSPPTARNVAGAHPKPLKPFDTQDVKILLLENVNQTGQDLLRDQGYQVEALKTSLPEDELIAKIRCVSPCNSLSTCD